MLFVIADIMSAMLIRGISWKLHMAYRQSLKALNIINLPESSGNSNVVQLIILYNVLEMEVHAILIEGELKKCSYILN